MSDNDDTYDNLTRLLNLGRRKRPRISRRYSYIVRGLRLLLPLIALALVAVVMAWPKMEDSAITPIPREKIIPKDTGRNELISPHFEGADKNSNPYAITAGRAVQSLKDSSIVLLEQPVADVHLSGGRKMTARADNGVYRQTSKILVLDGKVAITNESGYTIHSDRLNISIDDRISWTDSAVTGDGPAGTLAARAMNANNETGVVVLTGPAKLVLNQGFKTMKLGLYAFAVLAFLSAPVLAQDKGLPVEITADKTLEWHKDELQYVARGNAMVKKGNTTIKADLLTADYHATKKSGTDIYRMTGVGNVSIDDNGNVATGDKVVYDLDSGLATMTGDNLQMTSPAQTVTATESFQYAIREGRVKAIGNAKLVRGNDTLYGDQIDAVLGKDTNGNQVLDRMEAKGNVKIVTPAEVLTGTRAVYNARANTAVITGDVKITRDQNVLTGGRAEVDLTTNISRLFGSSIEDGQTGGRVKGVFYPGSSKTP